MSDYFRAVRTEKLCEKVCGEMEPRKTRLEAVTESGRLKMHPGGVPRSRTGKVSCFSKTKGGAVIGAVTGEVEFKGGRFCVCKTEEEPSVEVVSGYGDFPIIEEVRFKDRVDTEPVGDFSVGEGLEEEIEKAYVEPLQSYEEFVQDMPEEMPEERKKSAYKRYKNDYETGNIPRPMNPEKLEMVKEDINTEV